MDSLIAGLALAASVNVSIGLPAGEIGSQPEHSLVSWAVMGSEVWFRGSFPTPSAPSEAGAGAAFSAPRRRGLIRWTVNSSVAQVVPDAPTP